MTLRIGTSTFRRILVIDHSFIFDWRHVAAPLALTALIMIVAGSVAFAN
jgi:hypothetical protein